MVASRTGNVDAMKVLLDHGANVNAKEILRGTTALMWAADEGHAPAIQLLVQHGADIKAQSGPAERGRGPALGKSTDPRKAVAALAAALAAGISTPQLGAVGTTSLIPTVPDRRGAARGSAKAAIAGAAEGTDDADDAAAVFGFGRGRPAPKDGGGLTPLVYAVRANDLDSVKVLLAVEADVNQVTGYGWSPLVSLPLVNEKTLTASSHATDAWTVAVASKATPILNNVPGRPFPSPSRSMGAGPPPGVWWCLIVPKSTSTAT
jgi:hypothetical protein